MSMKYLGESFDLHTGGIDNLFPHHENEIAQAEAATGKPFVRTWLHCAHLRVNGEKMSKSAGNFFTLRDLLAKGYTGREVRYVLIGAHYRQPLNFTFDALAGARTALARIDEFVARLRAAGAEESPKVDKSESLRVEKSESLRVEKSESPKVNGEGLSDSRTFGLSDSRTLGLSDPIPDWAQKGLGAFGAAIADDLNTPQALAAVHGIVSDGNRAFDATPPDAATASAVLAVLRRCDSVLNLLSGAAPAAEVPAEVQALADERAAARAAKNWAESDRLRAAIAALGWEVRDSKTGQTLKAKS
jgi:cysteinyl-tRNA synthetase